MFMAVNQTDDLNVFVSHLGYSLAVLTSVTLLGVQERNWELAP